jgi:hypothetical protein
MDYLALELAHESPHHTQLGTALSPHRTAFNQSTSSDGQRQHGVQFRDGAKVLLILKNAWIREETAKRQQFLITPLSTSLEVVESQNEASWTLGFCHAVRAGFMCTSRYWSVWEILEPDHSPS